MQAPLTKAEVFERLQKKSISQVDASSILGLTTRHIRRILKKYLISGPKSLISRKIGSIGNHRLPLEVKEKALALIVKEYPDFGPTLAHEKLSEKHNLDISLSAVRLLMIQHEIWKPHRRRKLYIHPTRERRSCLGELIQIDGSPHDWFEGRGPRCTLLSFIDDATSSVMFLQFVDSETTWAYFEATKSYLKLHGIPKAFYSDRHGIFRVNRPERIGGDGITQYERALKEVGVHLICANSPQAKGRVERRFGTFQDRLVKELRLLNVSNKTEGNAVLPAFIEDFNRRFAKAPKSSLNAHMSLSSDYNLERIFTIQESRTLSKNLSFQ